jgi:hypothetical protein
MATIRSYWIIQAVDKDFHLVGNLVKEEWRKGFISLHSNAEIYRFDTPQKAAEYAEEVWKEGNVQSSLKEGDSIVVTEVREESSTISKPWSFERYLHHFRAQPHGAPIAKRCLYCKFPLNSFKNSTTWDKCGNQELPILGYCVCDKFASSPAKIIELRKVYKGEI